MKLEKGNPHKRLVAPLCDAFHSQGSEDLCAWMAFHIPSPCTKCHVDVSGLLFRGQSLRKFCTYQTVCGEDENAITCTVRAACIFARCIFSVRMFGMWQWPLNIVQLFESDNPKYVH